MSFKELVLKNRSYRRFFENKKIEKDELVNLVDIARNTASGANNQPLRYKVVCDEESNKKVFDTLNGQVRFQTGMVLLRVKDQQAT